MFDNWLVRFKIRIVMTHVILFILSFVMSCQELRYMAVGKTVDATLLKDQVETTRDRYGDISKRRVVVYSFNDKDLTRQESAEAAMDWVRPEGATVKVQYIAGHQILSRLLGQHHYGWVI